MCITVDDKLKMSKAEFLEAVARAVPGETTNQINEQALGEDGAIDFNYGTLRCNTKVGPLVFHQRDMYHYRPSTGEWREMHEGEPISWFGDLTIIDDDGSELDWEDLVYFLLQNVNFIDRTVAYEPIEPDRVLTYDEHSGFNGH